MEEVALERYGSLDEFNQALAERQVLDERESRRGQRRPPGQGSNPSTPSTGVRTPQDSRRFMFTSTPDDSRPPSRTTFRRPGGPHDDAAPASRVEQLRSAPRASTASTPIPSVFTPQLQRDTSYGFPSTQDPTATTPPMSVEQLNRLQAKVLRAKLMDDPNALELEDQYEGERIRAERANGAGMGTLRTEDEKGRIVETEVMPTLDGRGRLYDVGIGAPGSDEGVNAKKGKTDKVCSQLGAVLMKV